MLDLCKSYVDIRDYARKLYAEMEEETSPYRWNQLDRAYREVSDALRSYVRAATILASCTPPDQMYLFREVIQKDGELDQRL